MAPTPGPKPTFQIVEHTLKCQTGDGEISLDLRVSFDKLDLMSSIDDLDAKTIPRFILDKILDPADAKKLTSLRDGVETYAILMEFAKAVGERLGASLGESKGASDSSVSTDEPSAGTSATTSA